MFNPTGVHASIACTDLDRATEWYAEKLGLKPMGGDPNGAYYAVGETRFLLYPSQFSGTAQNTVMTFEVDDVEGAVQDLMANGITFEEYDMGEWGKTVNGVMTVKSEDVGEFLMAWFKDIDGNVLGISNLVSLALSRGR